MESVAALGVAAAAVQFFGVVVKAAALCRQIRDNADSATDYNRSLEASVRELRDVRGQLSTAAQPQPGQLPSSSRRRVNEWITKCQHDSDDLIKLLEEMRGARRNKNTARNLFHAIKDRRRIEKLEKSLQSKKEVLHEVLQHDTLRIAENQESSLQETLARLQDILAQLAQINVAVGETIRESTANINRATGEAIKTSTLSISKRLDQTDSKAKTQFVRAERLASKRHRQVVMQAQSHHEDLNAKANSQKFLESLFFPEILDRQNHIRDAESGTLEWIFETEDRDISEESDDSDVQDEDSGTEGTTSSASESSSGYMGYSHSATDRPWDDLAAWLRNDTGVYWVNGKAGSGKSTLMAHIVGDPRTKEALDICLLYQICNGKPRRINALMRRLNIEPSMIHAWSERQLKRAFHEVISIATGSRFCVFVDGLDEFDGNYVELVNLIFELQGHENVKFCVSSRPETQLSNRLSSCKTLRLQDLNFPDIKRFVQLKLSKVEINHIPRLHNIHDDLAGRAQGVFLWAALVTKSLVQGAAAGDDEEILLKRIESTPQGLDELFKSMLVKIERVHLKTLAFYLKALSVFKFQFHLVSIANLTATRAPYTVSHLTDFEMACKQTETQVIAQSAGLLEIKDGGFNDFAEEYWNSTQVWLTSESATSIVRERQTCTVEYPATLKYENRIIDWVHRSAYDFICDPDVAKFLHLSQIGSDELLRQLFAGSLALLRSAPSSMSFNRKRAVAKNVTEWRLRALPLVIWGTLIERIHSQAQIGLDDDEESVQQVFVEKILDILIQPHPTHHIRIAWNGCRLPRGISYDIFPARKDFPVSLAVEKHLATTIATLTDEHHIFEPWVKNLWHDIINGSKMFIEAARASPRLYMHIFGQWFYQKSCPSSKQEEKFDSHLLSRSIRFICFPWRETSQDPGGVALETERFLHFETCQNVPETIFPNLVLIRTFMQVQVVLKASIKDLRSVHELIIDDLRANKRHLSTAEQHLVLECLQLRLWGLLMSIREDPDEEYGEPDFSSELTDSERESISHISEERQIEDPDMQPSETIREVGAVEDEESSGWVTDDGGYSSSGEEAI
ncbi:CRAL-TRIO domain-containing protein [Apiospora arundinis]